MAGKKDFFFAFVGLEKVFGRVPLDIAWWAFDETCCKRVVNQDRTVSLQDCSKLCYSQSQFQSC